MADFESLLINVLGRNVGPTTRSQTRAAESVYAPPPDLPYSLTRLDGTQNLHTTSRTLPFPWRHSPPPNQTNHLAVARLERLLEQDYEHTLSLLMRLPLQIWPLVLNRARLGGESVARAVRWGMRIERADVEAFTYSQRFSKEVQMLCRRRDELVKVEWSFEQEFGRFKTLQQAAVGALSDIKRTLFDQYMINEDEEGVEMLVSECHELGKFKERIGEIMVMEVFEEGDDMHELVEVAVRLEQVKKGLRGAKKKYKRDEERVFQRMDSDVGVIGEALGQQNIDDDDGDDEEYDESPIPNIFPGVDDFLRFF